MKRFFLSRKTVISLIALILFAVFLSYAIPQRMSVPALTLQKWQEANPSLARITDLCGLDHLYTTPWFAVLLGLFFLTLCLSSIQQFSIARQKTFRLLLPAAVNWVSVSSDVDEIKKTMKKNGYLKCTKSNGAMRFVKQPWGYWGNFMLHFGILIVIVSSLLLVITQKRGVLALVENEINVPGTQWLIEERGVLTKSFILPKAVVLNRVMPEFWENDNLKGLRSSMRFVDQQGRYEQLELGINEIVEYMGITIYQSQRFGKAFYVELKNVLGEKRIILLPIENPAKRNVAGYGDFRFNSIPFFVRAKFYADAEKKSMSGENPLLVMRFMDRERLIGELSLKVGESGKIGPFTASLLETAGWSGIIFTDITGMPGIFFGFFIIIVGGGLIYFTPPREFYIKKEDGTLFIAWKATRFENFYMDEFERIGAKVIRRSS